MDSYNYPLPNEKIAKYPLTKRDSSKLLLYKRGKISESLFLNIADYLPSESLLVYNNTRVIHARLEFHKESGARVEIFCLDPLSPTDHALALSSTNGCEWNCMVGNLKKWKNDTLARPLVIGADSINFTVRRISSEGNTHRIRFEWDNPNYSFSEILETIGELPIPPYLNRKTEASDELTYQTVYSRIEGSVAAPTAGLHFTQTVFDSLKSKNIELEELTLHVGAGTFQPVKSDDIAQHVMHTETIAVPAESIKHILHKLGNIIAVGTTSVRTLESLYYIGVKLGKNEFTSDKFIHVGQWDAYYSEFSDVNVRQSLENIISYLEKNNLPTLHAETQILIKPGFRFRIVSGMITNFHQPKSTLLLLVSAFIGDDWLEVYNYALEHQFRFLSYGDSSLLFPE